MIMEPDIYREPVEDTSTDDSWLGSKLFWTLLVVFVAHIYLAAVGIRHLVEARCARRKSTRDVACQSQTTYTAVRGAANPRFQVLPGD
jgi:hypothetical protein